MNKFTKAVQLNHNGYLKKKLGKGKVFKVVEPFVWYLNYEAKKERVIVPIGFTTDFGSIPRFLWFFLSPTKYVSYILHDYLYDNKGKIGGEIATLRSQMEEKCRHHEKSERTTKGSRLGKVKHGNNGLPRRPADSSQGREKSQGREQKSLCPSDIPLYKGSITRLHADWILAQAMLVENREFGGLRYWLGFIEIAFVFLGVRIGGWWSWHFE